MLLRQAFVPAYWMAAAAMFVTALFPLQVMRRHALRTPPAVATSATDNKAAISVQSDEALLEDVKPATSRLCANVRCRHWTIQPRDANRS